MKMAQFFTPKKRRVALVLAGVFLVWIAAGAFAHGRMGRRIGGWTGMAAHGAEWGFRPEFFRAPAGMQGGYIGPLSTVREAQTLANKAPVRLRGTIATALGDGRYEFRDSSGGITVEVLPGAWNGVTVSAGDEVEITGWIRKPFSRRTVLVTQVQKPQSDGAE